MRKIFLLIVLLALNHILWAQLPVNRSSNAKPSILQVKVFDAKTVKPIPAWLTIKITDEANSKPFELKNGSLEKIFTKPVEIELTAFAKDYAPWTKNVTIEISPGGKTYEFVAALVKISHTLTVKVIDYETGNEVPQAKIELKDVNNNSTQTFNVRAGERQETPVSHFGNFEIICDVPGYLLYLTMVEINKEKTEALLKIRKAPKPVNQVAAVEEPAKPIARVTTTTKTEATKPVETLSFGELKKGKSVALSNIFFDQSSPVLRTESFVELDKLAEVLNKNPAIRIEIRGHTDNTGNFDANVKLSKERCESVVNYLTGKGISKNRLEFKGRGPIDAIAPNTTEENKKKNRRVEFIVL